MQEYHPRNKKEALRFFVQTQLTPFEKRQTVFFGEAFPSFAFETHQKKKETSRDLFNWDLSRGVL